MNDPNKRINVNKSSLLSLKAELLRKQAEVNRAKISHSIDNFVPKKMTNANKVENIVKEPTSNTTTEEEDNENSKLLKKSKKVLEAKSKLYDKLVKSGGSLNSDDNCLVLFNKKKQDNHSNVQYKSSSSSSESDDNEDNYTSEKPDEQWVEYTDCLGRTRKCLKKDLEFFKQRDNALVDNHHDEKNDSAKWVVDTQGTPQEDTNVDDDGICESDMIKIGAKHQQMKEQWEKQEMENVNKDFIHYQDILYDEARSHGVGYYEFSTNEQERQEQIKELEKIRVGTLNAQKLREDQRLKREKLIGDRVKAAKNRQRARLGLPPEEEKEVETEAPPVSTDANDEAEIKNKKKEKLLEMENQKREEERQRYIRPWDKGKSGVASSSHRKSKNRNTDDEDDDDDSEEEWKYKIEREPMSQEQWVAKKRAERNKEFAPLDIPLPNSKKQNTFTSKGHAITQMEIDELPTEHHTLFFTSKKKFVPKNTLATKIQNELSEDDDQNQNKASRKRAEIPPPPTMEYYGPSSSSAHKIRKFDKIDKTSLEQSIEAGLKFVRDQVDKGQIGTKSKWAANTDY